MTRRGAAGGRSLVVVADDLGLGSEVDQGILEAHDDGIVTAASALVVGPSFTEAARAVATRPSLDVGVHLALVGPDRPVSAPKDIPSLVDAQGQLARSWRDLLPRLALGRVDGDEVEAEWRAQIAQARRAGLAPTHLDTHQHVHLWPALASVLVRVACAEGIDVVRVPRSRRPGLGWGVGLLGGRLARTLDRAGLRHAEAFAGWDQAGHHTGPGLVAAVEALGRSGARTAELALHPGHPDPVAEARYRWGFAWEGELAAATDPAVRDAVAAAGFALVGMAAL